MRRSLKRRFFVLEGSGQCRYYEGSEVESGAAQRGEVEGVQSVRVAGTVRDRPHCLEITAKGRVWLLWADTEADMLAWARAFNSCIKSCEPLTANNNAPAMSTNPFDVPVVAANVNGNTNTNANTNLNTEAVAVVGPTVIAAVAAPTVVAAPHIAAATAAPSSPAAPSTQLTPNEAPTSPSVVVDRKPPHLSQLMGIPDENVEQQAAASAAKKKTGRLSPRPAHKQLSYKKHSYSTASFNIVKK